MPWPSRSSRYSTNPDTASTCRRSSPSSRSAALFSAPVKDEFFRHLPNLFITDAIGSSESGNNGMTVISAGQSAMKSGPTVSILGGTVVFDDDLQLVKPGSGTIGKNRPLRRHPLGYYNDPVKTAEVFMEVDGVRYVMPGDFATVEHDGSVTLLGRGLGGDQLGRGEDLPRRGRVRGALASPRARRHRRRGTDERWGQTVAAIIAPRPGRSPPRVHPGPLPLEHRRLQAAASPLHRRDHPAVPSGKPDYRWPTGSCSAATPRPTRAEGRTRGAAH